MNKFKLLVSLLFASVVNYGLLAQVTVKEDNRIINYHNNYTEVIFENNKSSVSAISAFDAFTNQPVLISNENNKSNSYRIANEYPGQIVRVDYTENNTNVSKYIASKSTSTGEIKVYFNHPVNTTYSQTQPAVNLGNQLDDKLISLIDACISTLDIAIYNSSSPSSTTGIAGAINAAYNRGVQVRIINDGSTSGNMISFLNPAIPRLSSPNNSSYGLMHNKFVIFDANHPNANVPLVWTGSTNWTVAQIDGPDMNNVITVQDKALALGYTLEFNEMWGGNSPSPNPTLSKFGPFKTDNTPHNYIIGGKVVESYFSPTDGVNSKIINTINSGDSDINIALMLITRSDISAAIINKYNSGLANINWVADTQNPSGNQFNTIQAGIAPYHAVKYTATGVMHHKFLTVDNFNANSDPQVLTGSHNWSTSAETKNDENTLIVHDADITNQYYQAFAHLYQAANGLLSISNNTFTEDNIVVYPNPSNGFVTVVNQSDFSLENATINIFDISGKKVFTQNFNSMMNENIDVSNQTNGIYFMKIQTENKTATIKLIKQ